jgi:phosphoribosyl-AMP cyclohydrolase
MWNINKTGGNMKKPIPLAEINFNDKNLIPVVVQDSVNKQVLMVAWMDQDALKLTVKTGEAYFWSRSRKTLWHKGQTSGNFLFVDEILVDCDADTLLLKVKPAGPACHTGEVSCFYRNLELDYA